MGNELEASMESWLQALWDQGGSDLLLSSNSAPRIRVDGKLFPLENVPDTCQMSRFAVWRGRF